MEKLRGSLADAQKELMEAKAELDKRVNASAPFINMKTMLQKKNATLKQLREALVK